MPKKYYRVSAHHRIIDGKQVWVIAHIRKNPKYKETKMNEDEKTEGKGSIMECDQPAKKEYRSTQVSVVIREADSHYIVTFDHGSTKRIFHNVEELLVAIEVEVKRLKP